MPTKPMCWSSAKRLLRERRPHCGRTPGWRKPIWGVHNGSSGTNKYQGATTNSKREKGEDTMLNSKKSKTIALLGAGALAIGLGFSPAQAANEIILGASLAKTGPYSTTARTSETAIDMAVEEINNSGKRNHFISNQG